MSLQNVREFIGQHGPSAIALAALGAALDARASGTPLDPALDARVSELLGAMGGGALLDGVSAEEAGPTLALLRFTMSLDLKLMFAEKRAMVWNHNEPEILQAGGEGSVMHAQALSAMVVPALEGLADRLRAPGARFLDVGTGVGLLAVAMARMWPELAIVGIDPWQPSLALARDNVAAANMAGRIELRELAAEALADEAAYDLCWLPIPFMQERAIPGSCKRVLGALRPGGWVVAAMPSQGGSPANDAVWRLRFTLWGGHALTATDMENTLGNAGYTEVQTLPSPPGAPIAMVVGRRAP